MIFHKTFLPGLYLIEMEPVCDDRGYFARSVDYDKFFEHGLDARFVQESFSYNIKRNTLRGLHFQLYPHEENKLIRATRGSFFDVAVDLRMDSPTFCKWYGVELSCTNHKMLYIPQGFAHGFQTLEDNTEILYGMTERYAPCLYRGIRWDDPAFGIVWPHPLDAIMNDRDRTYADFDPRTGMKGMI